MRVSTGPMQSQRTYLGSKEHHDAVGFRRKLRPVTPHATLYDVLPSLGFLRCRPRPCEATTSRIHRSSQKLGGSVAASRSTQCRRVADIGTCFELGLRGRSQSTDTIMSSYRKFALIILESGSTMKGCAEGINWQETFIHTPPPPPPPPPSHATRY